MIKEVMNVKENKKGYTGGSEKKKVKEKRCDYSKIRTIKGKCITNFKS